MESSNRRQRHAIIMAFLLAALCLPLGTPVAAAAATDWSTYHHDIARTGTDPSTPVPFASVQSGWSAPLDGAIYAEPLVVGNTVFVATENDTVYALAADTGTPVWSQPAHLGTPVTSGVPCGNVNPNGITGTPVADPAGGVLYVVGFVQPGPQYVLFALNMANGTLLWQRTLAPAGFDPLTQGQRSALVFANGMVYITFGGRYGDCGIYHGYVVGVPASGNGSQVVYQTPSVTGAPFWAASGPAVDGSGNLFVTSGNGSANSFDFSDSVIKLSPTLSVLDYFAPADWQILSSSDTDLGSVGPALLNDRGLVFQIGKQGVGNLLQLGQLSSAGNHIGGELYSAQVCNSTGDAAFGGTAYAGGIVFVPCRDGIAAVQINSNSFSRIWYTTGFFAGPPVISAGAVWTVGNQSTLYALDPVTGAVRFQQSVGSTVSSFPSLAATSGRLFVQAGSTLQTFVVTPGVTGGRGFQLSSSSTGAPTMTWTAGTTSQVYVIARISSTGAEAVLPSGTALPASATSYTDTASLTDPFYCYALFAFSLTSVLGNSDALCLLPNSRSAGNVPSNFAVQLNQSNTATLSWMPPGAQTGYLLESIPSVGATRQTLLPGTATLTTDDTQGVTTCYVLAPTVGGIVIGNSDILCGVPGRATLSVALRTRGSEQASLPALPAPVRAVANRAQAMVHAGRQKQAH